MKLLLGLDIFCGNLQIIGGHIGPPAALGGLAAGDFLLGAVVANLDEVDLLQLVAFCRFYIGNDLLAVGRFFQFYGDLAALDFLNIDLVVGDISIADIADPVFIAIGVPVLIHELLINTILRILLADQTLSPVGSAIRIPIA